MLKSLFVLTSKNESRIHCVSAPTSSQANPSSSTISDSFADFSKTIWYPSSNRKSFLFVFPISNIAMTGVGIEVCGFWFYCLLVRFVFLAYGACESESREDGKTESREVSFSLDVSQCKRDFRTFRLPDFRSYNPVATVLEPRSLISFSRTFNSRNSLTGCSAAPERRRASAISGRTSVR